MTTLSIGTENIITGAIDWALNDECSHVLVCMTQRGGIRCQQVLFSQSLEEIAKKLNNDDHYTDVIAVDLSEDIQEQLKTLYKQLEKPRKF